VGPQSTNSSIENRQEFLALGVCMTECRQISPQLFYPGVGGGGDRVRTPVRLGVVERESSEKRRSKVPIFLGATDDILDPFQPPRLQARVHRGEAEELPNFLVGNRVPAVIANHRAAVPRRRRPKFRIMLSSAVSWAWVRTKGSSPLRALL